MHAPGASSPPHADDDSTPTFITSYNDIELHGASSTEAVAAGGVGGRGRGMRGERKESAAAGEGGGRESCMSSWSQYYELEVSIILHISCVNMFHIFHGLLSVVFLAL